MPEETTDTEPTEVPATGAPAAESATPPPPATEPKPAATIPEPSAAEPHPAATSPATKPHPAATTSESPAEPRSATPSSDSPATEPRSATPSSDSPAAESRAAAPAAGSAGAARARAGGQRKIVFRIPPSAYVAVAFLLMCVSFVAFASPWYLFVYLLPLGAAVWVLRTRTEVDADRIVVRRVLTRTVIPWSAVTSLRLVEKGWLRVVRADGGEIALPTVRTRHLPALALISGGRITDPTAAVDQSVDAADQAATGQGPV